MRHLLLLVALATLASSLVSAGLADYMSRSFITEDWNPVYVSEGQVSLSTAGADSPCHIKAYGWKLLDTYRIKTEADPWYSRGTPYQKWGWKIVVHNAGDKPFRFWAVFDLKSDQGLVLDSAMFKGQYSIEPCWVHPGKTELLSGTSAYNMKAQKGEGRPVLVSWRIWHE